MSAEQRPANAPKQSPAPRDESLEDLTEQTAETMARAREDVDRARATLHDQIMPGAVRSDEGADPHAADGRPSGKESAEVRGHGELARWLPPSAFPADRRRLLDSAQQTDAPKWVVDAVRRLPDNQHYEDVHDLWRALGGEADPRSG